MVFGCAGSCSRLPGGILVNEWGFAAEIKSWWDAQFAGRPEWALDRCEVERQTEGSLKRSDLVDGSSRTVFERS